MEKIIALVDGSIYSASVCDHAAWIAQRTGAPVELVHVLGRREAADKHDLSGAIALGARTQLMQELAELDAPRAQLVGHRGHLSAGAGQPMLDHGHGTVGAVAGLDDLQASFGGLGQQHRRFDERVRGGRGIGRLVCWVSLRSTQPTVYSAAGPMA